MKTKKIKTVKTKKTSKKQKKQVKKKPVKMFLSTPIKYDPIDTTKKYTGVYLTNYLYTEGFKARDVKDSTLIGYCTESPEKVLEKVFLKYHVTGYDGFNFFGKIFFEDTDPMTGLVLASIKPVLGITGTIENIIRSKKLSPAKRKIDASRESNEIIKNITKNPPSKLDNSYEKYMYKLGKISNVLRKF